MGNGGNDNNLDASIDKQAFNNIDENSKGSKGSEPEFVYREGGWGWLVVIASGYCFGILIGLLNDYSLLYNQMTKDFKDTENHVLYAGKSNKTSY